MKIGDTVHSHIYKDKGEATIVSFSTLFEEEYAEILFTSSGERIFTKKNDLVENDSLLVRMQSGKYDSSEMFLVRNMALRIHSAKTEGKLISSANYKIKPLPHQLLTVNFVMNRFQPRCLIADEVGLGKTIEAILIYQEYKLRNMAKRVLIAVPSGLVLQWQEELREKFDEQFVVYTMEQIRALKQSHGKETNVWKLHDRIIVSLDTIKPLRIQDDLERKEKERRMWHNEHISEAAVQAGFDIAIIDEAHKLSKKDDGSQSARFKFGDMISGTVPIFLLLTATPHQGDTAMFHHLMKLIDPILFSTRDALSPEMISEVTVRNKKRAVVDFSGKRIFKHRITSLVDINWDEKKHDQEIELYQLITEYTEHHYDIAKRSNNQILILLVMLYQRILSSSSFAIRDTMKRRLEYLKHGEIHAAVEHDTEDEDVYAALHTEISKNKKELEKEIFFVQECIYKAESICEIYGDAKLKKLLEIIDEIKKREQNQQLKFIIFTEFRSTQEAICSYLSKFGYTSSVINGSLNRIQKAEQVQIFRNETQFLVSTDAGGEGINLQFCYCVINYDLPWNPARLEQRIGRVDRIGQQHTVLIFNLQNPGTIEDHVRAILEEKLDRIKHQFGEDKYADVLSVLEEEFDFDKLYLEAVLEKEKDDEFLNKKAQEIYQKAQKIIREDDLLIPFTKFGDDPKELYNKNFQTMIRVLLFQYLKHKGIPVQQYKNNKELYYFSNPFPDKYSEFGEQNIRNATFSGETAFEHARSVLINSEHPIITAVLDEVRYYSAGRVSAFSVSINKFSGVSGVWFVYELTISNNLGKNIKKHISVFLEDEEFENSRIGNYLDEKILEQASVIPHFSVPYNIDTMEKKAMQIVQEKSFDLFTAVKLRWLEEFETLERRTEEYNQIRRNAINVIKVENIRNAKIRQLENDIKKQREMRKLEKNIIPKLDLYQFAWLEFK